MNGDVDRIMGVMETAFDPTYGEAWTRPQVADALIMPNTFYLLGGFDGNAPKRGETTVGFALSRGAADEEELLLLAVHPEYRGRGIGSALLNRFIASAHARGATKLFLEMREGNRAEALYRNARFMPVGRRRGYYRNGMAPRIDAITFSRRA
ncbi:GNAT family N-acetyltransferase [Altericroceibacterium xinjiangense]|uniref:GNAT family N-acetyltransferase n=1 Tax=Altericroceibacterium xinjiangense TaxID=762261 RepID=UPI000F7EBEB3|nr:GNAT family N-acetyltransferase [Altericroceibacterium xinjiangense]